MPSGPRAATQARQLLGVDEPAFDGGTVLSVEPVDSPTNVPSALANGKIPLASLDAGLVVTSAVWTGTKPGDLIYVYLNGEQVTEEIELTNPIPDIFSVTIAKEIFDQFPNDVDSSAILQMVLYGVPGGTEYVYQPFHAVIDKSTPGGSRVPPIEFDEDIVQNGLTLAKLLTLPNATLPGNIANYEFQEAGDVIHLFIRLRPNGPEIAAGTVTVTSRDGGIAVGFDRPTLERIEGYGVVEFYHHIEDDVGHVSATSTATPLRLLIDDAPELIPAPIVPALEDDNLVIDPESRPTMDIQIPAYAPKAQVGDYFIVHVGDSTVRTDPLVESDLDNDPLLTVPFLYAYLLAAKAPYNDVFDAAVSYDVMRGGLASPSAVLEAHFDLTLPGGPDPDPQPDPEPDPDLPDNPNSALRLPTLRGANGSDNTIPADESVSDATGLVPRLNINDEPWLRVDDIVQLYIGADAIGDPHTVEAGDLTADLALPVTSAAMLAHSGPGKFYYGIQRTLATGNQVTAYSRAQEINILSTAEIPGAGSPLLQATFVEWVGKRSYAINIGDARDGCPVRILLGQANVGAGDTIEWTFQGYENDGTTVPETQTSGSYVIVAGDLVPKPDGTLPKPPPRDPPTVDRAYVDVIVPGEFILPIIYGRATFDYTITNAMGEGTATQDLVLVDVRPA